MNSWEKSTELLVFGYLQVKSVNLGQKSEFKMKVQQILIILF